MTDKEQYLKAMELILDAVAMSDYKENRTDIGMYLVGLVVADHREKLSSVQVDQLRQIIEMADEAESPKMCI